MSLVDGIRARVGVPSGALTGSGEAVELRDGHFSTKARLGANALVGVSVAAARAVARQRKPPL